jgi:hypothetical protein
VVVLEYKKIKQEVIKMGLDMYLYAKKYIYDPRKGERPHTLNDGKGKNIIPIGYNVKEVSVEAMYWRKANAIHKWFVDNVQGGVDECQEVNVSRKELKELLEKVTKALTTKNYECLPTQSGFFFGSTEYDDYYVQDLERTQKGLEGVLKAFDEEWEFTYRSSW